MEQKIRYDTFETNSSSVHNVAIIPESKLQDWYQNKLYVAKYTYGEIGKFIEKNNGKLLYTEQELIEAGFFNDMPKREDFENDCDFDDAVCEYFKDSDFVTADNWSNYDLEEDETIYTTESGEKLHILCQYGYDG